MHLKYQLKAVAHKWSNYLININTLRPWGNSKMITNAYSKPAIQMILSESTHIHGAMAHRRSRLKRGRSSLET